MSDNANNGGLPMHAAKSNTLTAEDVRQRLDELPERLARKRKAITADAKRRRAAVEYERRDTTRYLKRLLAALEAEEAQLENELDHQANAGRGGGEE